MAVCKRCGKDIRGKIKTKIRRRKVGKKSIIETDFFDEDCFYYINLEKALNEEKIKRRKRKN